LPISQLAKPWAQVALDAAIVQTVPVLGVRSSWFSRHFEQVVSGKVEQTVPKVELVQTAAFLRST
jgi:hypothetical protein